MIAYVALVLALWVWCEVNASRWTLPTTTASSRRTAMSDDYHDDYQPPIDRHDTGLIIMVLAVVLGVVLAGAYAWHQGSFWAHTEPTTHNCK